MRPTHIIIHHSAISREANHQQFDAIRKGHIAKGYGEIGYHFFLEPTGIVKVGRAVGETGAHCKSSFMNFRSIGICLAGNFDEELPNEEQMIQLKNLVARLKDENSIREENIIGHRHVAKTACPGLWFTDSMLKKVAQNKNDDYTPSDWAKKDWEDMVARGIMTKNPKAFITKEELAVVINRLK